MKKGINHTEHFLLVPLPTSLFGRITMFFAAFYMQRTSIMRSPMRMLACCCC